MDGVLDGQRVQAELGAEHVQVLTVGLTQVQLHHRGIIPEKVADLGAGNSSSCSTPPRYSRVRAWHWPASIH
jgi:hypothetical protein